MTPTASTPSSTPSQDITEVVKVQHERIRTMFIDLRACPPQDRKQQFDELRALLAVHEAAEELILRPASRQHFAASIADERNEEEKAAAQLLSHLEKLDTDDPAFVAGVAELQTAVEQHAEREERLELPRLLVDADADEREMLGRRFLQTEQLAPTHPHPTTAGSTTATALTGPFASMLDRAKDALQERPGPETD